MKAIKKGDYLYDKVTKIYQYVTSVTHIEGTIYVYKYIEITRNDFRKYCR